MSLKLEIINPLNFEAWDELVLPAKEYSFFYSSAWARVLYDSYRYKPLYFTLFDKHKLSVLIPLMEVNSFLTGRRGVSLPFSDYCNPIIARDISFQDVFDYLIQYGRKAGWKFIEIRGGSDFLQDITPLSFYYGHTLDLNQDEEKILSSFRSSTKRNIKKATREGVEVNICKSLESVGRFYHLNCITRKMHGLPPQPYCFFKNIYDYIISRNLGIIVLAFYNKRNIAGAIFFQHGEKAVYKYGALDRAYQYLRPSNLVMWEAIKWYCRNGYETLCFGRTEVENKGLRQFKAGWGTQERVIKYYRFNIKKGKFIRDQSGVSRIYKRVFHKMPVPLLKLVGSIFYRHMG